MLDTMIWKEGMILRDFLTTNFKQIKRYYNRLHIYEENNSEVLAELCIVEGISDLRKELRYECNQGILASPVVGMDDIDIYIGNQNAT